MIFSEIGKDGDYEDMRIDESLLRQPLKIAIFPERYVTGVRAKIKSSQINYMLCFLFSPLLDLGKTI